MLQIRQLSKNQSIVRSVYQIRYLSTEYVPGRKGYAPGFEPPEGTRESPKTTPRRRDLSNSLPSHLDNSSGSNKPAMTTESPKKLYRRELKMTRHQYARELLEKEGQRQMKSAEKLELGEKKARMIKDNLEKEKRQQEEHKKEIVHMLSLDKIQQEAYKERSEQRIQNRLQFEEMQRNQRRKELLKLYSNVDSFVTLDNLDAKVDDVLSPEGRSYHTDLDELMHNVKSVHTEIEQRKRQLKEAIGLL
ncbi:MAG: hypothetical protein EXX96DRAFT_574514 [Benjaminiella poitrasii]|nr:MAG: hypothetical protein EXX96DRAFT_574514 [Benjaminiella poitrasii]